MKREFSELIERLRKVVRISRKLTTTMNKSRTTMNEHPIGTVNCEKYRNGKNSGIGFFYNAYSMKQLNYDENPKLPVFHLSLHNELFSEPNILRRGRQYDFRTTGSLHIIADNEMVSSSSILKYGTRIPDESIYTIDDRDVEFVNQRIIEEKGLLARIKIGIVRNNGSFYFQILSMNHSPFINEVFLYEMISMLQKINTMIIKPVMKTRIPNLEIKNSKIIDFLTNTNNINIDNNHNDLLDNKIIFRHIHQQNLTQIIAMNIFHHKKLSVKSR